MCLCNSEKTIVPRHERTMKLQGPIEARDGSIRFGPTEQKTLAFPGPPQGRVHSERTIHQRLSVVIGSRQGRYRGTRRRHNGITSVESSSAIREVVCQAARPGG